MISIDFSTIELKLRNADGKTSVFDAIRKKWVALTPEEHVRQYMIGHLVSLQYPAALMAVEKAIKVGDMTKRFDIVIYSRDHKPWMLVECKAPEVDITEHTLHQLLNYQRTIQCPYWMLTNGRSTFCANATDVNAIRWIDSIPQYL